MPTKIVHFEGKTYNVPDDATMDEIDTLIRGGTTLPPAPPQTPTSAAQQALQTITPYLPTPQTAARIGGAMVGGVAGLPAGIPGLITGGAFGAAGGESLYQLIQQLRGRQPGVDPQAIAAAALQGAAQEGIGGAVTSLAEKGMQGGMEHTVGKILSPASIGEKEVAQKLAPQLAETMPIRATQTGLLKALRGNLDKAGNALEAEFAKVPANVRFSTAPIKAELQAERGALEMQGELVPGMEGQAGAYDRLIEWFDRHPKFTIAELRQNRQLWDGLVNWWKSQLAGRTESEAVYKSGADKLRGLINNAFPNIAQANEAVRVAKTGVDLLSKAEAKGFGKSAVSMGSAITGSIGAGIGGALGGGQGAGLGATAGVLIRELVQTPAWQTASIAVRRAAIEALQRGDVNAAVRLVTGAPPVQAARAVNRAIRQAQ